MPIIEANQDTFRAEVLESKKPVLVDFNATWCGPCQMMKPKLEELSQEQDAYRIVAVDIDENDELAEEYDVISIPCLVVFKDGQEVTRSVGMISKDAVSALMEG